MIAVLISPLQYISFVYQVEVEVEALDKGGNFIGWLFIEGVNLSISLVENGLSKMHPTAERSNYYRELQVAEEKAKSTTLKVIFSKWRFLMAQILPCWQTSATNGLDILFKYTFFSVLLKLNAKQLFHTHCGC